MYDVWKKVDERNASQLILGHKYDSPIENMNPDSHLVDWIDKEDRGFVVDFGCGVGRNTFYLADVCKLVYAYDFPNMLNMLIERSEFKERENIEVYIDWEELRINPIDAVFCCITLQHLCTQDLRYKLYEFALLSDVIYVHGRNHNDYDKDNMFELLSENWVMVKEFGGAPVEKVKKYGPDVHYYAKWQSRVSLYE